jgi:hypothetical protein
MKELGREQLETLWLHRAVAGKVVQNPGPLLAAAEINLCRLRRRHDHARPMRPEKLEQVLRGV